MHCERGGTALPKKVMPKKNSTGFPELNEEEEDLPTRPMPLHELPWQARVDHEMEIITAHHERVAKAIRVFWGHKDCAEYLQQLILSGGDGVGRNRIGFKAQVVSALINLAELHDHK